MQDQMNPQTLRDTQAMTAEIIAKVGADQLGNSTPCDQWNVGQLIDHLVGAQHWGTTTIQGTEMTDTGEGSSQADYQAIFDQAAQDCASAFEADGALEKTVNPGFGDMPGAALMGMVLLDTFTHAWDLATATGQDNDLNPPLADALVGAAKAMGFDNFRSEDGGFFKPAVDAPDDANSATKLAAYLGRQV